jgi:hypothetical protein
MSYRDNSTCYSWNIPDIKWVQWYPFYASTFEKAVATCWPKTAITQGGEKNCPGAYSLIGCVVSTVPAEVQVNCTSATVLLGVTPTLLSSIAPSIGEISMLSSQRPILSFLLSVGGPALFAFRPLTFDDPIESLKIENLKNNPLFYMGLQSPTQQPSARQTLISLAQYVIVLVAIANVTQVGWQLGLRTVVSWKAGMSSLPFLWASLPAVIHIFAAGGWHCSSIMHQIRKQEPRNHKIDGSRPPWLHRLFDWLYGPITNDITICAARPPRGFLNKKRTGHGRDRITLLTNLIASIMAFVLLVFGTLTFSSLLFISTLDAVAVIARYLLSSLVCRFVLMVELNSMILVENGKMNAEDSELDGI